MPVPMITSQIIASSKSVDAGWSFLQFVGCRSSASKDGKSVNHFFEFEAISGPNSSEDNKGRRVTNMVNGQGLATGITEACNSYIGMMSALTGLSAEDLSGKDIDETQLVGKKIWAEIHDETREGRVNKKFVNFLPEGLTPDW